MSIRELRRHVGQLLIAGFDGVSAPVELRAIAREFDLGGAIFFARNVESPDQVAEASYELRMLGRDEPAWVAIDQEGGRVARLRAPFTEWPPMAALGRADDEALVRRFAAALGAELAAVGVTLDFAPVLDVHTNPRNPVIGDRALGDDATRVGRLGRIIIETLQGAGIAACGKHFPGHGDTAQDSHVDLPLVEHAPDRLRAVEFVPFRSAIEARVATIMTAHVLVPALDAERPASLSPAIIDGLLRRELGYEGVILSDDLEMRAVSDRYSVADAAVGAVAAGCDAFLVCSGNHDRQVAALEGIVRAAQDGRLALARVEDALRRCRQAKERFLAGEARRPLGRQALAERIGRPDHQAIADEMRQFA